MSDDRIEAVCCDCGRAFLALGEWQTRCRTCYARFKDGRPPLANLAALQAECAKLRAELAALRAELTALRAQARKRKPRNAPIPPDQWRGLLQLSHPDKHANSEAATLAARWLLENRPL